MDTYITHYLRLVTSEQLSLKVNEPAAITIENLSTALFCTPRNVKFILRKLEAVGFICWQPGIGRGHHSKLTLLKSMDEVMEDHFLGLISNGKMKEAVELIGSLESWDWNGVIRQRLLRLLNQQMGFHSHMETSSGQDVLRMMRSRRLGIWTRLQSIRHLRLICLDRYATHYLPSMLSPVLFSQVLHTHGNAVRTTKCGYFICVRVSGFITDAS